MMVTILYFASLRERLGISREVVLLPAEIVTVKQLLDWLIKRGDRWSNAFTEEKNLRVAINQRMSTIEAGIGGEDEIAFFPPVTGG